MSLFSIDATILYSFYMGHLHSVIRIQRAGIWNFFRGLTGSFGMPRADLRDRAIGMWEAELIANTSLLNFL